MKSLRILLVDDHQAMRNGVRAFLRSRADWTICGEAADGVEAVEKAKELRPDAVLMDISMPRMDGLKATQAIRQELPETKVIIFSQNDPAVARRQAAEVQANGYVGKANLARDLIPAIDGIFGGPIHEDPQRPLNRSDSPSPAWLNAGGEMGAVMRSTDWSKTPLGAPETWSPALRMMVKFLLANRFPQLLWWGPQFCSLYNDAYAPILGAKHPWAVGQPVSEVWREIWHVLKPLIETPFHGGPATWMEDIPLEINRRGFVEETHFTIAYSPVPDDTVASGIGGVLATVHEITEKVIGERRIVALRDLGARSVEPRSAEEACSIAAETLARHSKDAPFVLLYLLDAKQETAQLVGATGVDINDPGCLKQVHLAAREQAETWPFSKVLETGEIQLVCDLQARFQNVPRGPWSDPPNVAALAPIRSNIPHQLAGFMIAGISPRLCFDESYYNFLELMSTQIATTIANAWAYEDILIQAKARMAVAESEEKYRKLAETLEELVRARTQELEQRNADIVTQSEALRDLSARLLRSQDDERRRIARELHDSAGQTLAALAMAHGRITERLKSAVPDLCSEMEDAQNLATVLSQEIRTTSYLLHPPLLEESGLVGALGWYVQGLTDRSGIEIQLEIADTFGRLSQDMELAVFRIVQEALTNIHRHSGSKNAVIRITRDEARVHVEIRDTGKGMPPERLIQVQSHGSGVGLGGMRERVRQLQGEMGIQSDGSGTRISAVLPVPKTDFPNDQGTIGSVAPAVN